MKKEFLSANGRKSSGPETLTAQTAKLQCEAGWYDWFCQGHALVGRLQKIARVVMGITEPYILDNYYVWFKNNCPLDGPLYDDVRFEPLTGERDGKYFLVSRDCPYESMKWTLYTERSDFKGPEFACRNVRDMIQYVNNLGRELDQNLPPAPPLEKQAGHKKPSRKRKGPER